MAPSERMTGGKRLPVNTKITYPMRTFSSRSKKKNVTKSAQVEKIGELFFPRHTRCGFQSVERSPRARVIKDDWSHGMCFVHSCYSLQIARGARRIRLHV